jgi:hypothetical protein
MPCGAAAVLTEIAVFIQIPVVLGRSGLICQFFRMRPLLMVPGQPDGCILTGGHCKKIYLDSLILPAQTEEAMNYFSFEPVHAMIRRSVTAAWCAAVRPRKAGM